MVEALTFPRTAPKALAALADGTMDEPMAQATVQNFADVIVSARQGEDTTTLRLAIEQIAAKFPAAAIRLPKQAEVPVPSDPNDPAATVPAAQYAELQREMSRMTLAVRTQEEQLRTMADQNTVLLRELNTLKQAKGELSPMQPGHEPARQERKGAGK